ncbi:MAG: hypothetical protein PHS06_00575 [Candidatus Shapirobacteria bacterium]|nr:hypothetical protein [Candidatus Shapirobacteria bacterium]
MGFSELIYLSKTNQNNVVLGFSNEKVVIESAAEDTKNISVDATVSGADARPMLIKKYLEKYNSPMAPYSDLIFQISEDYGFEYYWIVAIAQQESNLCKKAPEGSYNCWGYGIHKKGTLKFDGYELAIKSYAEYLKREYFDKGLNTPELMMKKYCPSSNGSWANGVNQFIEELKSGSF